MAHYAILNDQNIVDQVIPGKNEGEDGIDWEVFYGNCFNKTVKRTSVNTLHGRHIQGGIPFRINFAGVGMRYDPELDGFIYPQPYPSWVFNALIGDYEPPVPAPNDGWLYQWNENNLEWVKVANDKPANP